MSVSGIDKSLSGTSGWIHGAGQRGKKDSGPDYDQLTKKILEERDQDGDGLLSASELRMSRKRFAAVDADSDGFVSQEELAAHVSSGDNNKHLYKIAAALIEMQDTDGDGKLSENESELSREEFQKADTDGDGFLTQSEIANALGATGNVQEGDMPSGLDAMRDDRQNSEAKGDDRKGTYPVSDIDSDATKKSGYNERKDLNGDGVVSPEEVAAIMEHGFTKAKAMVASGELSIKTENNAFGATGEAEGTAGIGQNSSDITGAQRNDSAGGRRGVPPWLRRRAMEAYEGHSGSLLSSMLGGASGPVADTLEGAGLVAAAGEAADQNVSASVASGVPGTGEMISALI